MDETIVRSGEDVYERLRSDIIFGRLQPNEPLRLERLRKSYGVSVGTLREALCRLTPGGLVKAEDQRGFQVAPCSLDGLREVAELRLLLEEHALTQSFSLGDMEWEGQVVAAHYKLSKVEQQLIAGDDVSLELWKRYDFAFHRALVSACGSVALLEMHAGVYDRYLRYQMVFGVFRGSIAAEEHRALLDAALKRSAPQAITVLEKHVRACVDFIVSRNGRSALTSRAAR